MSPRRPVFIAPQTYSLSAFALAVCACGEPTLDNSDAGTVDAGADPIATPIIDSVPPRAPYKITSLRGQAPGAKRVIVQGAANPIAAPVLPGGVFCVDVPTPDVGTYAFQVVSQSADGRLSLPANASTEIDPSAPAIAGAQTCGGGDPAGCSGRPEVCDGQRDDDCDGLSDARDPDCATCDDDALEPNDTLSAPRIEPRRYDGLAFCPGSPDWYGVFVEKNQRLDVRIFFAHATGNLDLELHDGSDVLAQSITMTDDEALTYTATAAGELQVAVFSDATAATPYAMDISVSP